MDKFHMSLTETARLGRTAMQLTLARGDREPLRYRPGQFINLQFTDHGRVIERSYSIANPPRSDGSIVIVVMPVEDGGATRHLLSLRKGDRVRASGPHGRFLLPPDNARRRYILVGTGTGIAPYHAMLPTLRERLASGSSVVLLYGVRHRTEVLYRQSLLDTCKRYPGFTLRICYSDPVEDLGDGEYSGYVQRQFDDLDLDPDNDLVFLCGNPHMIIDATRELAARGFPESHTRSNAYRAP